MSRSHVIAKFIELTHFVKKIIGEISVIGETPEGGGDGSSPSPR